jgi:serine 3-dehydrogenase
MVQLKGMSVFITGASSGIGEACARAFAAEGCHLLLAARRKDRIDTLARELASSHGILTHTVRLDVSRAEEVHSVLSSVPAAWKDIDILVNNAGLSRGLAPVHEGELQDWDEMIDTNIKGLLYVTRAILPSMVKRNAGHVINLGSIAGHQLYPSGNVYCASKFFVNGLSQGMRMDLLGTQVRVTSVDPGLVQTEFSDVRFRGNTQRAAQVYKNMRPLKADDVAEIIIFCVTRPPHVDIAEVIVMPTDQASVNHVHRTA